MKKREVLSVIVLSFLCAVLSFGQNKHSSFCQLTTETETQMRERLIKNKKFLKDHDLNRSVTTYVPVKIHLVGKDDGEDRMSVSHALDMLCVLNDEFEDSDIQFYMKDGFSYVDNTMIYLHEGFNVPNGNIQIWNASLPYKAEDAINIFVTNNVGGSSGNGGNLSYFSTYNDCLYIKRQSVLGRLLAHEMGHFFSLVHPFIGWEIEPLCEGQVDPSLCDIAETQSGSNCETTGDLICDTPPDYLFALCIPPGNNSCEFTGEVYDCEGTLVDPMENNMMSFFEGCPDYEFTEGQNEVMLADLFSPERAYCNPGGLPSSLIISTDVDLVSPENEDFEIPFNTMHFEWEEVQGASHYLLEVDRVSNFNFNPYTEIVTTTEAVVLNYGMPNTTYYWRVRPFNEYLTCGSYSEIFTFESSNLASNLEELSGINNWTISPNPISTNEETLYLEISSNEIFSGEIVVQSVSGKVLFKRAQEISENRSRIEISIGQLSKGVYLVSIQTKEGRSTKRVVVQ